MPSLIARKGSFNGKKGAHQWVAIVFAGFREVDGSIPSRCCGSLLEELVYAFGASGF
jgi:hypothetical protein